MYFICNDAGISGNIAYNEGGIGQCEIKVSKGLSSPP